VKRLLGLIRILWKATKNKTLQKVGRSRLSHTQRSIMYFVTWFESDLIETYDCRDLDEAMEVRDMFNDSGFEAVIVYMKG
jgi:hypothetical protein